MMNFKKVSIFLFVLTLIMAGCTYSREVTELESFSAGCWSPDRKQIVFVRLYDVFRRASGVTAFPDGGMPKKLFKSLSMYIFDLRQYEVKKITDIEGVLDGYPPHLRISWRDNLIAYYLISIHSKEGIYILNSDGSNKRQLVEDGMMPDISPDAKKIVYLKKWRKDEVWIINIDGTNNIFITSMPGVVYPLWEEDGKHILLYCSNGGFKVFRLNLETREINNTNLPYLKFYGNVHNLPNTTHIINKEWGVPKFPKKVSLPF